MDLLTDTPTPVAESSPAPVSGQSVLDRLSAADRLTWEQTGELPSPTDAPAASSPAAPDAQAASTEAPAPPASESGTPAEGKGLKKRHVELDHEIQSLQEKLRLRAQLRDEAARLDATPTSDAKPGSSPAAVDTDPKPALKDFVANVGVEFDSYEDAQEAFHDARDRWTGRQAEKAARVQQQEEGLRSASQTFSQRMEAAAQADPSITQEISRDLVLTLKPFAAESPGVPRGPQHDLAEAVLTSEQPAALLRHLSLHPDVYQRVLQSPNPFVVYREIGRLEGTFSASTPQARSSADQPTPKSLSSAPPPPTTLGTKPSVATEDWKDAVARGDFSAYERSMNGRPAA